MARSIGWLKGQLTDDCFLLALPTTLQIMMLTVLRIQTPEAT